MPRTQDEIYMKKALTLAAKGRGQTSPNPAVGSVVVRDGEIIGRGYHQKAGLPHAEIEAISDAENNGKRVEGTTLYVTLEPCCHTGKRTPPCVDKIREKGFSRVVVGCLDQNERVSGKGVEMLLSAGIEVETGVLEEECRLINEDFFKYIATGHPFVTLKLASTLDGKIAANSGDSKWIGSDKQRRLAHKLRSLADGVMVGIGTVLQDDPRLNVRLGNKALKQPVPIVLDSTLQTPLDAAIFKAHESPVIAATQGIDPDKMRRLESNGARVVTVAPDEKGRIDLKELLTRLGEMGFMHVLIEGGGDVAASAIKEGIVDKLIVFYSPKIVGGDGVSMIGALGIDKIAESIKVGSLKVRSLGEEFYIEAYL